MQVLLLRVRRTAPTREQPAHTLPDSSCAVPQAPAQIAAPLQEEQLSVPKQPVGFLASATVLDSIWTQAGMPLASKREQEPEPRTVISNKHAADRTSKKELRAAKSRVDDTNNVAAIFNTLMASFAGRSGQSGMAFRGIGKDCEVKLLVKQVRAPPETYLSRSPRGVNAVRGARIDRERASVTEGLWGRPSTL
jgi:hypothetical protein